MSALVRINGEALETRLAVQLESFREPQFLPGVVRSLLIRQYAERNNIRNTDQELQLAVDEFRYSRGLESVDAVRQWMKENHQSPQSLQESLDLMLLNNKVRNAISDSDLRAYYAEHQLEFEQVDLYSIRVDTEEKAKELLAQTQEEGANFHVLAMEHSQDEATRASGGYAGRLKRSQVTPTVEASAFKSKPVAIVGPVKTDHGWNIFRVTAQYRPTFEDVRDEIRIALFDQLLKKLRSEATEEYPIFDGEAAGA